jgi:outer membrane receptor protein involved in Fe transport
VKYLTYVPAIASALQAIGSLSSDNWGIHSGALELQWKKELAGEWLVNAGARYYTQSSADFYAPLYLTPPGDAHSSDYRLAGFGSIAWLAGVTKQLTPNFSVQLAAERSYRRAGLRSGGTGIDADDYTWSLYLVTLQARF